jgi:hypothetical protein
MRRDRERQDAVAQEREPGIGVRASLGPGRVREDLPVQLLRQLVEQVA